MGDTNAQARTDEVAVSVVIPTRDRRRQIERCLSALSRQTHADFEVVIVDDGSSDGTIEWIEEFSANHPEMRVRCVKNTDHLGANRSRNRGIQEARGSLIAFLDSDCLAEPDWLDEITRSFNEERVAAATGLVENPPPDNIFELTYRGTNRVHARPYPTRLVGCNMCIRRDLLLKFPLDEDLKYGCDEEGIYLRLRALGL